MNTMNAEAGTLEYRPYLATLAFLAVQNNIGFVGGSYEEPPARRAPAMGVTALASWPWRSSARR